MENSKKKIQFSIIGKDGKERELTREISDIKIEIVEEPKKVKLRKVPHIPNVTVIETKVESKTEPINIPKKKVAIRNHKKIKLIPKDVKKFTNSSFF